MVCSGHTPSTQLLGRLIFLYRVVLWVIASEAVQLEPFVRGDRASSLFDFQSFPYVKCLLVICEGRLDYDMNL
jgi:hypothetical protein